MPGTEYKIRALDVKTADEWVNMQASDGWIVEEMILNPHASNVGLIVRMSRRSSDAAAGLGDRPAGPDGVVVGEGGAGTS